MDDSLELEFRDNECNDKNLYSSECNKLLLKKEVKERMYLEEYPAEDSSLYPDLNDPNFNVKIAKRKEFNDMQYDGSEHDIEKYANESANSEFELAPHQIFVKNYLSFQTPYNSLLLYHQLGTGKTCSAIGICEEMRIYLKESGITKRIIVVASPNVEDNFRLQLFDERKLKEKDGLWSLNGCVGNTFIKEINPTNIPNVSRDKIVSQIKTLINKSYIFMGYEKFSNYISRESMRDNPNMTRSRIIDNLQTEFSNRLIVIDEVHNIRSAQDVTNKKVATQLMKLVTHVSNLRLLLLSATPMYNSVKEIVWLLNLMNINDRRSQIDIKDIFNSKGELKDSGKELLIQKATGYISYVRGENPYTFPFRVYPNVFSPKNTFASVTQPEYQVNGKYIQSEDSIKILKDKIYLTDIGDYQDNVYKIMVNTMMTYENNDADQIIDTMTAFRNMDGFKYTMLQGPLEALNICYPLDNVEDYAKSIRSIKRGEKPEKQEEDDIDNADEIEKDSDNIEEENNKDDSELFVLNSKFSNEETKEDGVDNEEVEEETIEELESESDSDDEKVEEVDEIEEKTEQEITIAPKRKRCPNGTRFNKKEQACVEKEKEEVEEDAVDVVITRKPSSEYSVNSRGGDSESPETFPINIDTSSLTGKKGLIRVMKFDDTDSPPVKGNFSYRLEENGRIFSPELIGTYSSKIKNICDNVMKSTGIIVIYSQWIDSGLIPMALALEELGFVRNNNTTLFKTPPVESIDAITMKPKSETETGFSPAKYTIISGDVRLSPDNDEAIKQITNNNNKDGKQIKVVLISKAASEGIDLKCVRQIHIMEPWYTLSRIEQIIGRGVRNLSHILLPFKERNVEIFLHGTTLKEKQDEAVDVYIYRTAEYKAKQIGEVSRILKETAIDCLLNTEQNNFTQANMNKKVEQVLSNGIVTKDFKVGDIPYSAMCDYMEDCTIKCTPNVIVKPDEITEDTYNESFIRMNSEKIIKKIRMLFTEDFFYKKDNLLSRINHPNTYPLVEIYSALTQLIDDKTEVIVDKYNRSGRLVNIGEYYIFQPLELTSTNMSSFDVSVPIDYKPSRFSVKRENDIKNLEPEIVHRIEETDEVLVSPISNTPGKDVLDKINNEFLAAKMYMDGKELERGNKNFYMNMGVAARMVHTMLDAPLDELQKMVIHHSIDVLPYKEKVHLLNYITSMSALTPEENFVEYTIKTYFDKFLIRDKNLTGIVFFDVTERHFLIFSKKNKSWIDAEPEDIRDLSKATEEKYTLDMSLLNPLLGIISNTTRDPQLIFRIKDLDLRSRGGFGTKCDNTTKSKNIGMINKWAERELFTSQTSRQIVDITICCFQELMLRFFNTSRPEKVWFMGPDTARILNL